MYSPALFSAVLLFTAPAFSHALVKRVPADSLKYDPAMDSKAESASDKPACKKTYKPHQGETCSSIANESKKYGKPFSADDFISWNPSVGQDCKTMYAGVAYCIEPVPKNGKHGQKKPSGEPYRDSKSDGSGNGDAGDGDYQPGANPPGRSTVQCGEWYQAQAGDTCLSIAYKKKISWDDFLEWNHQLVTINRDNVKVCGKIKAGLSYCVGRPTTFRAIGYYHRDCKGEAYQNVSVPPGTGHNDGLCIDTNCKIGSLWIPGKVSGQTGCPDDNVQIGYYESKGCGSGPFFGYGYTYQTEQGHCRNLWDDGWSVQSLQLRCAPKSNDCAEKGRCRIDGEPQVQICKRPGVLSVST